MVMVTMNFFPCYSFSSNKRKLSDKGQLQIGYTVAKKLKAAPCIQKLVFAIEV